jgi:hypothetical protein
VFRIHIIYGKKNLNGFNRLFMKVELHVPSVRTTGRSIGFCEMLENSGDATKLHK